MSLLQQAEDLDDSHRKPESCERIEKSDDLSLAYYGTEILTVDELLAHAKVDLKLWEVIEQRVNNWEVTGKKSRGQDESRRWLGDELWKTGNRQITVKLKRRAPKPIQDAIKELLKDAKPLALKPPTKSRGGTLHMGEIGIYDHHYGKLCWGEETGNDYDLKLARSVFRNAVDDMLERMAGFNVELINIPIGNDFFHVNDWLGQTANGTRVESVDDRFEKVFRVGCEDCQYMIERAAQRAKVRVIWVPGNHDRNTSWFLVEVLRAMFHGNRHIEFDNGPRERKYITYGPSLIGYVHGDEGKHSDLPALMATEVPDLWAASRFRAWRLGHWHKKKETRHTAGDTFNGVEIRLMPSLCGTDAWHYRKGFTGNARMAECWLWSKTDGPVGHFVVNAKDEPAKTKQRGRT